MSLFLKGILIGLLFGVPVGVFALAIVSDFFLEYQTVIHLAGGGIVLLMGIRLLFRKGGAAEVPAVSGI